MISSCPSWDCCCPAKHVHQRWQCKVPRRPVSFSHHTYGKLPEDVQSQMAISESQTDINTNIEYHRIIIVIVIVIIIIIIIVFVQLTIHEYECRFEY